MNSNCYSIAERLNRLEEFREWMIEHGLRVAGTRIEKYINIYREYVPMFEARTFPKERLDEFVFILREVEELIWIYRGLSRTVPAGALETLQMAIRGAFVSREEGDTSARNHLLELRVASFFLQASTPVDMSKDADLVVQLSNVQLHVECKRLDSRTRVPQRAKEALKQLKRRCSHGPPSCRYGMAVFDVGRVLHPNQGLAYGGLASIGRLGIRDQLNAFEDNYRLSDLFCKERRVIAIWYQIITPLVSIEKPQVGAQYSSLQVSLVPSTGIRGEAFQELRTVFETQ